MRASLATVLSLSSVSLAGLACAGDEAGPGDRRVVVADPLAPSEAIEASEPGSDRGGERFLGTIEFVLAQLDERWIGPTPLEPGRLEPGATVAVEFTTTGLAGTSGRLGLLAPRAAARQEVAFDQRGQPEDPRNVWIDVAIDRDGPQRFELPGPGPDWHAPWAVVALELRRGRTPVPVRAGPRSEMLGDETRSPGARAVLGLVPVTRKPSEARAPALSDGSAITLDGILDEPVWQRAGQRLVSSRTGEPAGEIAAQLGGPTLVWFAWDADNLYVAGDLPDFDLYTPHRERDDPLYRDEAFEVFIAADASGERYLEHQIAANGVVFDAYFPRYRKGQEGWDGDWRGAVALDGELGDRGGDRGWTVELAFPWAELCAKTELRCASGRPKPGASLRVNVFRLDKPAREAQVGLALSPTIEPDFHAWDNAAILRLEAPEG